MKGVNPQNLSFSLCTDRKKTSNGLPDKGISEVLSAFAASSRQAENAYHSFANIYSSA